MKEENHAILASGQKRKRGKTDYSEKAILKDLDAAIRGGRYMNGIGDSDDDDDKSVQSEYSDTGNSSVDESLDNVENEKLKAIVKATKTTKNERHQWGGKAASEWLKDGELFARVFVLCSSLPPNSPFYSYIRSTDAEQVLKALQTFGYGNVPWNQFIASMTLSKSMKPDELKRMTWSLALICLQDAAQDHVNEATRKAEASAKSDSKAAEGDVLARIGNESSNTDCKEVEVGNSKVAETAEQAAFKKILAANDSWASKALTDAHAFSLTTSPRDESFLKSVLSGIHSPGKNQKENPVQVKLTLGFEDNVWPALRSRGWKEDPKQKIYTFGGQQYKSIAAILNIIPSIHPELSGMVHSLIASVEAACKEEPSASCAPFNPANVTGQSLKKLIQQFAPLQILADRNRNNRIKLHHNTMVARLSILYGAHKMVALADASASSDATLEDRNTQLVSLITVNPKTSLPHPEWTLMHDAILIRTITKHGFIDRKSHSHAIETDKTIRWGHPFEVVSDATSEAKASETIVENKEKKSAMEYEQIVATAKRATAYLDEIEGSFKEGMQQAVINEIREKLVTTYGLVEPTDEEGWKINEDALKDHLASKNGSKSGGEDLPKRKLLVKRFKKVVMTFIGKVAPEEDGVADVDADDNIDNAEGDDKNSTKSHGFQVIDQTSKCNILLAEMVRGLLKVSRNTLL